MASNKKMTMIPINGDWKKQQKKKIYNRLDWKLNFASPPKP